MVNTAAEYVCGNTVIIPWVQLLVAGFPCTSRSRLNVHSAANCGCVQQGAHATGEGFGLILAFISKHRPCLLLFENVKELQEIYDDNQVSDADWVLQELNRRGYHATLIRFNCLEHGSTVDCDRCWFLAFTKTLERNGRFGGGGADVDSVMVMKQWVHTLVGSMRIPKGDLEAFIIIDHEELQGYMAMNGFSGFNRNRASKKQKADPLFKNEHFDIYAAVNMKWPPPIAGASFLEPMPYLSPRQQELVYFVHTYCKPEVDGSEFMNMNMSLKRLVAWSAIKPDFVRNPWKRHIPILTGRCNILTRKTKGGQVEQLRALEGVELMALIGLHHSFWRSFCRRGPLVTRALDVVVQECVQYIRSRAHDCCMLERPRCLSAHDG
jgi:hypothetical protein